MVRGAEVGGAKLTPSQPFAHRMSMDMHRPAVDTAGGRWRAPREASSEGQQGPAGSAQHGWEAGRYVPRYSILQLYKVQQFRCYRSGLRHLLGEYGGIEADRQTNSSRQQAAADS